MSKIVMMIGIPYSGKSFEVGNIALCNDVIISSDAIVEAVAASCGLTYNDVFESVYKITSALMYRQANRAIKEGKNVVWDQTNLTVKSREKKLALFSGYEMIAVDVRPPDFATMEARRKGRGLAKIVPREVIQQMLESYEPPTFEQFDRIYRVESGVYFKLDKDNVFNKEDYA